MEAIPDEIAYIKPFILRSEEMKVADPVISFYVMKYAMMEALEYHKKNPNNEAVKQYMINAMQVTETKKQQIGEVEDPNGYFEKFLTLLFVSADNDDRKTGSTKATAQKFLVLSFFIQAMAVFGETPPDWEEKRKYCKWKAADILKAIKRGEVPQPGGPAERNNPPEEVKNTQAMPLQTRPETFNKFKPENQPEFTPNPEPPKITPKPDLPETKPVEKKEPRIEPKVARPPEKKEYPEKRTTQSKSTLTKEQRLAVDQAKKFANNGIQELEYRNVMQAITAFENAIRALSMFTN